MIINKKFLAKYSPLPMPSNFNYDTVMNYIDIAEKIWVLPVIGHELYEELKNQVKKNEVSPENGTLLTEALWPLLGTAVVLEALPFLWTHISEVGITLGKSDNSDSVTLKDLTLVQTHLKNQLDVRGKYLYDFLNMHYDSYPLWVPADCWCACASKKPEQKQIWGTPRCCPEIR